ncbi:DUF47 domain-containing protein [Trichococcus ilyis]|jgi:predicted phosphate transport protein (TIGR00153 family)|uniref:Putative phosphate transport regulator n=1 Tax=Trichococcus ilyis TaxID=640938 RepID=A0A143YXB9_9LACT|nr:DUF47 family protein [Trichococcus ilyis]CZR00903.1 putative phosphate transport regulator [Trichococcus ilyis]SEJ36831.1 hypothetical protein SAMN05216375_11227 [Trichococcus ilyis]
MLKRKNTKEYSYYQAFIEVSALAVSAAKMVTGILTAYDLETLEDRLKELHEIEHAADQKKHKMMSYLYSDFLPPLEREDIIDLAGELDTTIDTIEDALIHIDIYQIKEITPEMIKFMQLVEKSALSLDEAINDLKNFKKSKVIKEAIIAINRLEKQGDALYTDSVKKLFVEQRDALTTMATTNIYDRLERATDSFEAAADVIERIVLKNS